MRLNDTRGSMPFAVIAVALLVVSAAGAALVHQYAMTGDDAGGVLEDIDSADGSIEEVELHVNRGLGEVVRRISTAESVGRDSSLEARAMEFERKASEWLDFQFPIRSGNTVVRLLAHDLSLTAEAMGLETADGGYTPAYLKGTGTIDVEVSSQYGTGKATVEVSTDGTYGLPLVAGRASLFENMVSGGGLSVSQMISYQLTSLAQYRVMNGYGSLSEYGDRGTRSIITGEDVEAAFRNAMEAVELICFRDGEGILFGKDAADLSDLLVAGDGSITLDLSAVYAQALVSVIDDVALSWFDYFCGFKVLDALERVLFPFRGAVDSLVAFILGEEAVYSAVPYVMSTMEVAGIPESEYRNPGSGTTTLSYGGVTVSVENPTADIASMPWLKNFKKTYSQETNFVMEFLLRVLNGAAVSIAENRGLGSVSVEVDAFDGKTFTDTLAELFCKACDDGESVVEACIGESLSSQRVYDPFSGAIAEEIYDNIDDFVLSDELRSSLLSAFSAALPEDSGIGADGLASSKALEEAIARYESEVRSDLEVFRVLEKVESGRGVIERVLSEICAYGLSLIGITGHVPDQARAMCDEIVEMGRMNPHGGILDLPGSGRFGLTDEVGQVSYETMEALVSTDSMSEVVGIDYGSCIHTVGFREGSSAAYSTMFTIDLHGVVTYDVEGTGTLSQAMGTYSSALSGSFVFDTEIDIPVSSGWPLAGIEYEPSSNFYDDLVNLLLELLEPIVEPLRTVMEAVRNAVTMVSEALVEALRFVSEQMARIYEAIMDPLGRLSEWFDEKVGNILSQAALDVLVSIGMDKQLIDLEFFGCLLRISTKAVTWAATTKTLLDASLTMPVAGLTVTAGIVIKARGDVTAENLVVTGYGEVSGDDWNVQMSLDPLMKGSKYMVTLDAEVGDTDISLVAPKLDSYQEMGIALSDVPGLGEIISNIPVMGVNVGLDAGFSLKYADPEDRGLVINEFETNPEGDDKGNEWVELYNNSVTSIDIDGFTLTAASDRFNKVMELSGSMAPGELLVIHPDFTMVNSSGKYTKNGEALTLRDADGNELDRTPTKKDTANDGNTWQRKTDGSTEWVFAEGSPGRSNGDVVAGLFTAAQLKDSVWKAVEKSFDRIGSITDLDTLQSFLQYLVRYTLEELIGIVSGRIIEAKVFASLDVKDATSSVSTGVEVSLRTDGDLAEDVLKYISGKVLELIFGGRSPYRIDPVGMFTENIELEVTFSTGIGFPELLSKGADLPEMELGITFRTNLAAITRIIGEDTGRPEVVLGVRAVDVPEEALPSKLSPKKGMDHDLWLMLLTVRFA